MHLILHHKIYPRKIFHFIRIILIIVLDSVPKANPKNISFFCSGCWGTVRVHTQARIKAGRRQVPQHGDMCVLQMSLSWNPWLKTGIQQQPAVHWAFLGQTTQPVFETEMVNPEDRTMKDSMTQCWPVWAVNDCKWVPRYLHYEFLFWPCSSGQAFLLSQHLSVFVVLRVVFLLSLWAYVCITYF